MGRDRSRSMSSSSSGRAAQSTKWDGTSGHRIHVSDLAAGISRREVERAFAKFGPVNEVWVATNPPCFAFINFTFRNDAEKAIREVDGKVIGSTRVGVTWARERTFGGRSRGGRGAPFGSYRSSGGSRRRSRSRSRSDSRRDKRRQSRSRSRDRHRRRSVSPRDRKHSRRTSKDKNGNDERKASRQKSKTPHSRSRSRSTPRKESRNDSKKRSQSHDSNSDAKPIRSTSTTKPDTQNRSPLIVDNE